MAYSRNAVTLRKNLKLVEPLLSRKDFAWHGVANPHAFAYKIRECLYVAMLYPDEFPQLAEAAEHYRVMTASNSVVAMYLKKAEPVSQVLDVVTVITNPISVMQVIEAWNKQDEPRRALQVVDCGLSVGELSRLEMWAAAQVPAWHVVYTGDHTLRLEPLTTETTHAQG